MKKVRVYSEKESRIIYGRSRDLSRKGFGSHNKLRSLETRKGFESNLDQGSRLVSEKKLRIIYERSRDLSRKGVENSECSFLD